MGFIFNITLTQALIVATVVAIVIVIYFVWLYFKQRKEKVEGTDLDRELVRQEWKKIVDLMEWKQELNSKLAVLEADKLLDHVLRAYHFQGETMDERLKTALYKFPKLQHVVWAHKVHEHIKKETTYVLRHGETKYILKLFKRALKELGAL